MKIVTFDVETIPDESRRDIIRPIILERLQVDKPELFDLMEGVGEQGDPDIPLEAENLVCYNGLNFDLQVIRARSARLGIKPTRQLWNAKPWEDTVIDVWAKRWPSGSKGVRGRKLDQIAEVERIPIPERYYQTHLDDFTGANVLPAFKKGDLESIGTHCELDVIK